MKKFMIIAGLCWLWAANLAAQTLEAKINRDTVPEGETFLLSVELKDAKTNGTPDFSVLNQDFTVYSVANSYRTNIINGNVSQSQQWNLVLLPNKTGKLTIPAIALEQYKTLPLEIVVGAATQNHKQNIQPDSQQNRRNYSIDAMVDNHNPYVQQQIDYVVTILDNGGLQGDEPIFQIADENAWIIKSLGSPEVANKIVNEKNQREIKFRYALFAQKSGEQELPRVQFNGYYLTKDRRSDPFSRFFDDDLFVSGLGMTDVFATKNPVILTTKPIKINVRPAAQENKNNWWLPAESVSIKGEFSTPAPQFKVGEAISRTIYLQATGVIDSQLPELKFAATDGLKQYPEKPQINMQVKNGKIIATEKINNVYIPETTGKITLPSISVNWFNVKTNTMETAVLPALDINVRAGATTNLEPISNKSAQPRSTNFDNRGISATSNIYWLMSLAFAGGIGLCLLTILIFRRLKQAPRTSNYQKQVIGAAQNRKPQAVRDALIVWARSKFANRQISGLQDVDDAVNDKEFRCELDKLTEALYAKEKQSWNEHSFIRAFKKICKQKKGRHDSHEPLPQLYK